MPKGTVKGTKQIVHEMLPSRHARAQLGGGDIYQRSLNNYAKQSPADLSGVKTAGLNINTMSRP